MARPKMEWAEGFDDTTGAEVCTADNGIFDFDIECEPDLDYTLNGFEKFYLNDGITVEAPQRTLLSYLMDEDVEVSQEAAAAAPPPPKPIKYKVVSHLVAESPEITAKVTTQFVPAAATALKGAAAMALAAFMAY